MNSQGSNISLRIINNTTTEQPISLFSVANQDFTNGTTDLYTFDLSAENFIAVNSVQLQYSTVINPFPAFVTIQDKLTNFTIAGVVAILNSFNVGVFSYLGTTIYVSSNFYQYNDIIIS